MYPVGIRIRAVLASHDIATSIEKFDRGHVWISEKKSDDI